MTKKIFGFLAVIFILSSFEKSFAQVDTLPAGMELEPVIKDGKIDYVIARPAEEKDLSKRANDHLMIQLGYIGWTGAEGLEKPASSFNREVNISFMYDKPFKKNSNMSVGFGLGYSGGNVFFKNVDWALKEAPTSEGRIVITDVSNERHFEKYKIVTQYLEIPVELRYASLAEKPSKSFRAAVGLKAGYLIKSHTKGKNLVEAASGGGNGSSVYGKNYILKENEGGNYLNSTRFTGTVRFGYNVINIFGTYQINPLFKSGATQGNIRPFTVGIGLGIL